MTAEVAALDTGIVVAAIHRDDADHESAVAALREYRGKLVSTEAVLTEAMYLLGRTTGGQGACLDFFLLGGATLLPTSLAALSRCQELMSRYADLPADFADVTLITAMEELDTRTVFSLDRRGFSVYRDRSGRGFEVLP